MYRARRLGVTVLELLMVIGIIGVLVSLLLPAIQAARESARKVNCKNNLRQLGTALQLHHSAHVRFPSNGWGYRWVGEPGHQWGQLHPGGWIHASLGFLEQDSLSQLGASSATKEADLTLLMHSPLGVLHCPSRRGPELYPYLGTFPLFNVSRPDMAAKCDYAGNGGSSSMNGIEGPSSTAPAAVNGYAWPDTRGLDGIFFVRSQIGIAHIKDGTSQTYLVGEKHVSTMPDDPTDRDRGDDQTAYLGDDVDIRRWTEQPPRRDSRAHASMEFGSAARRRMPFSFLRWFRTFGPVWN